MKNLLQALPAFLLVLSCATRHAVAQHPGAARTTPIILDQAGPDIFPKSWLTPPVSARAELLKVEQQQRSRRLVERARLLVGDAALWRLMEKYPKLRAKAALVIGFYHHLDPAFTRERFLSFRQSAGESSEKQAPP